MSRQPKYFHTPPARSLPGARECLSALLSMSTRPPKARGNPLFFSFSLEPSNNSRCKTAPSCSFMSIWHSLTWFTVHVSLFLCTRLRSGRERRPFLHFHFRSSSSKIACSFQPNSGKDNHSIKIFVHFVIYWPSALSSFAYVYPSPFSSYLG